jgi:hypothetical protein
LHTQNQRHFGLPLSQASCGFKIMTDTKLTKEEAYLAMFAFLEAYYLRGKSGEIGGMLGSMSLLQDGRAADSAIEKDWDDAIEKVIQGKVDAKSRITK